MKRIGRDIAKQAKNIGICEEWYQDLKRIDSVESLANMYLNGIDFCLGNNFPSNDYIRANFKGEIEKYGIHLDEEFSSLNGRKVVALGTCKASVEIDEHHVSEIFVKNHSTLNLEAKDCAFVMVDVFDNTKIKVKTFGDAKVVVNRYGDAEIILVTKGKNSVVKIVDKNKKTY